MLTTLYATRWHQNTDHELSQTLGWVGQGGRISCLGFTARKNKLETNNDYTQDRKVIIWKHGNIFPCYVLVKQYEIALFICQQRLT